MRKFKEGDRIREAFLGEGTFIRYVKDAEFLSLVKFDRTAGKT